MKGVGPAVPPPLAQPPIRIRGLMEREELVVSAPVKVIVCATSSAVHCRKRTGVLPQTWKSDEQVTGGFARMYIG